MMPGIAVREESGTPQTRKFWPYDLVLGILPLLIGIEILLWVAYLPLGLRGFADFRQLYSGGYLLRTGHAAQLYDYATQQRIEEDLVPLGVALTLPINHPAYEELLFVPLSLLPYRAAYWLFMALNGVLLSLCAIFLCRFNLHAERWKWLPVFLLLAFFPISRTLQNGQDSIIFLSLMLAALWALDRKKEFAAGVLVGAGMFKFQIVIPIAILLLIWRRWKSLSGFGVSALMAVIVSVWLVGFNGARQYVDMMVSMSLRLSSPADMSRYATDPREMFNVRGLISALCDGRLPHSYIQLAVVACSAVVLFAAARHRPSLPLAITAASLVSYHFLVHDASILVIPIAAALSSESVWTAATAALLLIAPLCGINTAYGYLAAIPLLALFVLMLLEPESGEFDAHRRQLASAEVSPCP